MRFKVKNISIITALVLALSLCMTSMAFGASEQVYVYQMMPYTATYTNDYKFENFVNAGKVRVDSTTPLNYSFYNQNLGSQSMVGLTFDTLIDAVSDSKVVISGTLNVYSTSGYGRIMGHLFPHNHTEIARLYGSGYGFMDADSSILMLSDMDYHRQFDRFTNSFVSVTDSYYWSEWYLEVTLSEDSPFDFQVGFYVDNADFISVSVNSVKITSPTGQVIDVVEDGFSNITGGWNSGSMNNSNTELGGALGDLDDMQQNADNDLHDALGDLESPTVDFDGNAVSFITSSVAMLWGSLGGFSAVLLCALFITVFNFISRYRGS